MTEKRFIEFLTQNTDDGELNTGFMDIVSKKSYHTKDSTNAREICALLNTLADDNEQLKKEVESKQRVINAYEQYINDLKEDGVLDD